MSEQPLALLTDGALLPGVGAAELGAGPSTPAGEAPAAETGPSEFAQVLSGLEPAPRTPQALPAAPGGADPHLPPLNPTAPETLHPGVRPASDYQDSAELADIKPVTAPLEVRKPNTADVALGDLHGRGTHGPRTGHLYAAALPLQSSPTDLIAGDADPAIDPLRLALAPAAAAGRSDVPAGTLPTAVTNLRPQAAITPATPLTAPQDLQAAAPDDLRSSRPPLVLARAAPQDPVTTGEPPVTEARSANPATALTALDALRRWAPDNATSARLPAAAAVTTATQPTAPDLSSLLSVEALTGVGPTAPGAASVAPLPQLSGPGGNALAQITDQIQVMVQNDQREARIQLHPRELGVVNIRLSLHADQASLVLEASNPELQRELSQHLPRLREAFSQEGLNLSQFSLEQQTPQQQQSPQRSGSFGEPTSETLPPEVAIVPTARPDTGARLLDIFA